MENKKTDALRALKNSKTSTEKIIEIYNMISKKKFQDVYDLYLLIAQHKNTPDTILCKLLTISDNQLLHYVAANGNLPEDKYEEILAQDSVEILSGLAKNPNISETIQIRLFETPQAREKIGLHKIVDSVLANPSCVKSIMFGLINSADKITLTNLEFIESSLIALAGNPSIPEILQEILALSGTVQVKLELLKNKNIGINTVSKLTEDFSEVVSKAAKKMYDKLIPNLK